MAKRFKYSTRRRDQMIFLWPFRLRVNVARLDTLREMIRSMPDSKGNLKLETYRKDMMHIMKGIIHLPSIPAADLLHKR